MSTTQQRRQWLKSAAAFGMLGSTGMAWNAFADSKVKPDAKSALIVVDVQNCFVTGGTLPVKDGEQVVPVIIDGLRKLEYRGYDSAGIATLVDGRVQRRRAPGCCGAAWAMQRQARRGSSAFMANLRG